MLVRWSWSDDVLFFLLLLVLGRRTSLWALAETPYLPAPQNVIVESYNFQNVLRWSPVKGINDTVSYTVENKAESERTWKKVNCTDISKPECTFRSPSYYFRMNLRVRAEQGNLKSNWTEKKFREITDTILGPPREIKVSSEGITIHLSFSPPFENRSYSFLYSVFYWEEPPSTKFMESSRNTRYTFKNLKQKTKYCFRVNASFEELKGQSSDSYCAKTAIADATKNLIIMLVFGFAFILLFVSLCLTLLWKKRNEIKIFWQPPLKIPAHYIEDLQNPQMIMAVDFPEFTEHYDSVSVISVSSIEQTVLNNFTSEHQHPPLLEVHR